MNTNLLPNEAVVKEGPANMQRGMEAVGGRLFLTNQRLVFESHGFNLQTGATLINLAEIEQTSPCWTRFLNFIPLAPNSLAVKLADGKEIRFVVSGRNVWKEAIDLQIQQGPAIPQQAQAAADNDVLLATHSEAPVPTYNAAPIQGSNGMGIAGFIVSMFGIVTCGVISPIGLLLSLFGLRKQPRGLAVAGTVIGLAGTLFVAFIGFGMIMAVLIGTKAYESRQKVEEARDMISDYHDENDTIPTELEGNEMIAGMTDSWGNNLRYEISDDQYLVRSPGYDAIMNSEDDIVVEGWAWETLAETDE